MRKELIAYTAGLVDGEGSIQINPNGLKKGSKRNRYWGLSIQVSSGDGKNLKRLCKEWGVGKVGEWLPKGSRKDRRSYNWRLYSKEAELFLQTILPYLRIKKQNAKLALKFRKLVGFSSWHLPEKVSEKRTLLALKMRELNQKFGKGLMNNNIFKDKIR